jgi:hypothetical protein
MESSFRRRFDDVRVHTGPIAEEAAQTLDADAFTIGTNIFFAKGAYEPTSRGGRWILAHELAHVVQQTRRSRSLTPFDLLERSADAAADIVSAGGKFGPGFDIGKAPFGALQCHSGSACRGTPVSAGEQSVWLEANELIEGIYLIDPRTGGPSGSVIFGSQFETGRDILPPKGFPNKRFAEFLLQNLRGIRNQRRPDIIDFKNRVFYEIKTVSYAGKGRTQIESYYKVAETIRATEFPTEPPWRIEYATWYPPHEIPMTLNRIVCTQATDHIKHPALILYDVRKLGQDDEEKQRQVMVRDQKLTDFDTSFNEMRERLKIEMRHKITTFDPENPEYVIIVPKRYYIPFADKKMDEMLNKMAPGIPPFLNPKTTIGRFHKIGWTMVGLTAAAFACFMFGVMAIDMIGMEGIAAMEAELAGGAGMAGGAEVIELAAFRAVATSAAVKQIAKAAGVIFVVGLVNKANAAGGKPVDVMAIRAVPLSSLRTQGGSVVGFSKDFGFSTSVLDLADPTTAIPADVKRGAVITFNGEPHVVIGKMTAS